MIPRSRSELLTLSPEQDGPGSHSLMTDKSHIVTVWLVCGFCLSLMTLTTLSSCPTEKALTKKTGVMGRVRTPIHRKSAGGNANLGWGCHALQSPKGSGITSFLFWSCRLCLFLWPWLSIHQVVPASIFLFSSVWAIILGEMKKLKVSPNSADVWETRKMPIWQMEGYTTKGLNNN